jgi:hypothetical protein
LDLYVFNLVCKVGIKLILICLALFWPLQTSCACLTLIEFLTYVHWHYKLLFSYSSHIFLTALYPSLNKPS